MGHIHNQAGQSRLYLYYVKEAAACHWCIGIHWFTLCDQSASRRSDGEIYNIGILNAYNNPFVELMSIAR